MAMKWPLAAPKYDLGRCLLLFVLSTIAHVSCCVVQALSVISDIGDMLLAKYSRQPVPKYSENDEDFRQRHAVYLRSLKM